jgi:hypothetical protein
MIRDDEYVAGLWKRDLLRGTSVAQNWP